MTVWHLTSSTIWPHDLIDSKISLNHESWQDIIEPWVRTHHWTSRDTTSLMYDVMSYDIIESWHHRFTNNGATDSRQHFLFKTYHCVFGQNYSTVKLQIFVRYLFSYFRLETGSYVLIFVLSRVCEKMTLKFNGFKAKRNFHTILNFVLFQKYEMYKNKYRTEFVTLQYQPSNGEINMSAR